MQPLLFPRDLLKFLYWIFFKPITLGRYLKQLDPDFKIDTSLITIRRHGRKKTEVKNLLWLTFFHILITPWPLAFAIAGLFTLGGFHINWLSVAVGVAFGVAGGVAVGMAIGVTAGVAVGVAFGAQVGMAFGLAGGLVRGVAFGAPVGMAFGLAGGVVLGVAVYMVLGVVGGVALGVALGVVGGVAFGVALGVAGGVAFGVGTCTGIWLGYFRLLLYLFEAPWSWLLSRRLRGGSLRLSPTWWDEIIWLPLPSLDRYLLSMTRQNRQEGLDAIAHVASSFRQNWAAKKAVIELMIDDVEQAGDLPAIARISETLGWLPQDTRTEFNSLLLGLDTISRHARAAIEGETPYNRQEQLRLGLSQLESARFGLAADPRWQPARRLIPALKVWEDVFGREYALAQEEKGIPNVYVAGSPLALKSKVFKGRHDIFRALERELVSQAEQRPAILLFGARRMGKTSVLRQLPEALGPQVIPVMIDLQSAALSVDAFSSFEKIAEEIHNSALSGRGILLADISKDKLRQDPYRTFSDWMENIEKSIGERWFLLCLDEYEYLEKMLDDRRIDERFFQLLRTLIQNHPRLTLLVSGAHTLEDLKPFWSNYLINVRVIKIAPLSDQDAQELITQPIPDFPLIYEEGALDRLLYETSGHPYLIQSTCQDLVHRLNEQERFDAKVKDVEQALNSTLTSGAGYFNDLWNGPDSSHVQRAIQIAIAHTVSGSLTTPKLSSIMKSENINSSQFHEELRNLIHRDILTQKEGAVFFNYELIRRWIRQKQLGLQK